ncbi:MAG TPA: hypothetical protein DEG71_04285 [Clostridiales bacterium]|nr:hypothetical protein [Clostridiales bacterium]
MLHLSFLLVWLWPAYTNPKLLVIRRHSTKATVDLVDFWFCLFKTKQKDLRGPFVGLLTFNYK